MKEDAILISNFAERPSGIEIIGNFPWGSHFCQFYRTKQDLLDILVPYFKSGLENGELCVWVTSEFLDDDTAKGAMEKAVPGFWEYSRQGQMEIFPYTEWYLKGGKFEMGRVLKKWLDKYRQGLAKGFCGLRVSGNPFWLESKKDWHDFSEYESNISGAISGNNILVLCTYSLDKCGADEVIDVVKNHQFALIKREGNWETIESAAHKETQEALRASEEKYRNLVKYAPAAIFEVDFTVPRYVSVNDVMCEYLGYTSEELLSMNPFDIMDKESAALFAGRIKKGRAGEKISDEMEYKIIAKNGHEYFANLNITFKYDAGKITGAFVIAHDITDRKRAELALRASEEKYRDLVENANSIIQRLCAKFFRLFPGRNSRKKCEDYRSCHRNC